MCVPTFGYFKALAIGIPVMDRQWLQETENTGTWADEDTHRVWGDKWLCRQAIEVQSGSSRHSFLKSTLWWRRKCGPCQLPPSRECPALNSYAILVLDPCSTLALENVAQGDDTSENAGQYHGLTASQVHPQFQPAVPTNSFLFLT